MEATSPAPPSEAEPPATVVADVDEAVEWSPHKCHKRVWPSYDADYTDDNLPPEREYVHTEIDGEGGATLDEKAAALANKRPSEGVCDTRHRDNLEAAILRIPSPKPDASKLVAWDRKSPLEHRDRVRSTLALTAGEEKVLEQNGFVVPERLSYSDYTTAYYDIHRGELPVYVSADSILHAVYASHDQLVAGLEREQMLKHLDAALGAMHCGLSLAAKDYPSDVANDLDLYLTVARSLLAGQRVPSELGKVGTMVDSIVDSINAASRLDEIELFGRRRAFDVTQYTPRGHYAGDESLERYFRTAMWLSRTEFNLVSRDSRSSAPGYEPDPRETPREAVVALALADLAKRTGASTNITAMDRAWASFAGRREDVPFAELEKLRVKAGIKTLTEANVADRLRTAIGDSYKRTVNVHPGPNVTELAAIATMLGPRITPDTVALGKLTDERGPDLQAAEVGFMLGHDRGLAYVKDKQIQPRLTAARDLMVHAPIGDDLYGNWLEAIRSLSHRPQGAMPSFMDGQAYADLRLDSAIAAYGQLRHNHVLIAAQVYDVGGCEIPDGYVEPAVETYKQLAEYAKQGRTVFRALDPKDTSNGIAYFTKLERLMNVLVALSREELANRPLSADAKRFLSMIVEMRPVEGRLGYSDTIPIASWDGWYIDLFPNMDVSFKDASFMADYATYNRDGKQGVHYIGARGPRLGVFVVDTGGKPRVMVGPVANAFQHTGELAKRLTDKDAQRTEGTAPWAKSYTAPAPKPPTLAVELHRVKPGTKADDAHLPWDVRRRMRDDEKPVAPNTLRIDSAQDLGVVSIELLDHHFVKMGSFKVKVLAGRIDTPITVATKRPIESVRIIAGEFQGRADLSLVGYVRARFGNGTLPSDPQSKPNEFE